MKRNRAVLKKTIMSFLSIFIISFIFYNSALDAQTSTVYSVSVLDVINSFIKSLNIEFIFTDHIVRKCAHFVEYFVLATVLFYTVYLYVTKYSLRIALTCTIGFIVACVDEVIQLFSSGRSSQFSDVLLDFFGVCVAIALSVTISKLYSKNKCKSKEVLN